MLEYYFTLTSEKLWSVELTEQNGCNLMGLTQDRCARPWTTLHEPHDVVAGISDICDSTNDLKFKYDNFLFKQRFILGVLGMVKKVVE